MNVSTEFLDGLIERFGTRPDAVIPILQEIQQEYRYLPIDAMRYVCDKTEISSTQLSGVSTFYTQFRLSPVGKHLVKVCHGTACHVGGAGNLSEALEDHLDTDQRGNSPDMLFTLENVACLGCCSLAPVIMVDQTTHGKLARNTVVDTVEQYRNAEPMAKS